MQTVQSTVTAPSFNNTKAYHALNALSEAPIDLTKEGVLTPERIEEMKAVAGGFTCLFGFERVTNEVMGLLFELANERKAIESMEAMQRGDTINAIAGF